MAKKQIEDTRKNKLARMAERGGTEHERKTAAQKLNQLPAIPESEEQSDQWIPLGNLIRIRNNTRAFLRGTALKHFLNHVVDGVKFSNRTVPLNDDFGSGDFYVILSWLIKHNLCIKHGSKYEVPSKQHVVRAWNKSVDEMKIN